MSKEAIQYELRDAIHEHGPDCIVIMGDADFVDLLKRIDRPPFINEIQYLGVRVISNGHPGTHGYIIGSTGAMLDWVSTYGVAGQ